MGKRGKFSLFKVIFIVLSVLLCNFYGESQTKYEVLAKKAERFYKYEEWESAAAMYELMLMQRSDDVDIYSRAITVNGILGKKDEQLSVIEKSQKNGIAMSAIFDGVRSCSYAKGYPAVYESLLLMIKERQPWLRHSINGKLATFYRQRNNAPKMVEYADSLLTTRPDDLDALTTKGLGLTLLDNYPAAIKVWKEMIEIDSTRVEPYLQIGVYLYSKVSEGKATPQESAEAKKYLTKAYQLKPTPKLKELLDRF